MNWSLLVVLVLLVADVASALLVVVARHENRTAFVELQDLQAERDELGIEWGRLQLEQSAWATHGRIERLASEKLDMVIPAEGDVTVLRRAQ